jgi:acyl-CoA hydrolase
MTHWTTTYAGKVTTAEEAVRKIRPGGRIFVGTASGAPQSLVNALAEYATHCSGNEVVHLHTMTKAPYTEAACAERFRHTAFFIGANVRKAVQEGRADFMPVFLSEIPRLIRSGRKAIHVALIQVSPPDRHGFVSLGTSVDVTLAAVESAELVFAEVNPNMPRTLGESFVSVRDIDGLIPVDYPLPELESEGAADEVCTRIGQNVASLIHDGCTLQMGIGRIPDAVLAQLDDRNDLGVHTEMFSDGVMRLATMGVINGRRKTHFKGKIVSSFLMGSRALFEWVNDNPMVEMQPSDIVNDPTRIARNADMVAINSALAVDLTGQVAADTLMGKFFSGIGGQVDFIRGAKLAPNGKAVIALPATAKNGEMSRIQATFEEGAGVVTSRGDVQYVVTEFGIADLWGRSIRERAEALIAIAHPDHRGEIRAKAVARKYFPM